MSSGRSSRRASQTAGHLLAATGLVVVAACSGSGSTAPTTSLAPLVTPSTTAPTPTAAPTTTTPPTTAAPTSTLAPTTTLPPTTTTTFPFVNDGAFVLVANAADVPGAASDYTEALAEYGFAMLEPTNGAGLEEIIDVSRVYARPDPAAQAVGLSVARVMGGLPLERMPTPAPIEGATDGLGEATVLVMLGRDLAERPLPGPPRD